MIILSKSCELKNNLYPRIFSPEVSHNFNLSDKKLVNSCFSDILTSKVCETIIALWQYGAVAFISFEIYSSVKPFYLKNKDVWKSQ
ncbi:hypothetical protein BpHYR1_013531 [Brachionus plicatilis]|uniref:Uncharacterized protein n=1 Tax=Brachionus plicatilis TaxID=10195 RepID=A0A3M7SIA8_BRAPC|nr:hypothetical protein BpHYR1_013531 [Brachionus plicatilis]